MNYQTEIFRTNPDYVAYIPRSADGSTGDSGNEHFLVNELPDGSLFGLWTQSSYEGLPDQRIVGAKSRDGGKTWSAPVPIVGPDPAAGIGMASWAFPLFSKSGRIYLLYSRHTGVNDVFFHTTGLMACVFSDDRGETWSRETILPMPRSKWDNPDPKVPANWIVWQQPVRLSDGCYFTGFTRWVSPAARPPAPTYSKKWSRSAAETEEAKKGWKWDPRVAWWAEAAVVEFMRFENIDQDPRPEEIEITYLAGNDAALQAGLVGHPDVSAIQEPSVVELPDGRLFCVMRTTLGSPYYSVSRDGGAAWTRPEPLRQYDDGPLLRHPCSPCPLYRLDRENYLFFYHNHDGNFLTHTPLETEDHRRPVCLARGAFRPGARQPVWFSEPWFFMDNGGVPIQRADMAMYSSVTRSGDDLIFWYPDRKFFLLGRKIASPLVKGLAVPHMGA